MWRYLFKNCQTKKFTNMSDLEKKARIFSNTEGTQSCKSMREVEYDTGRYVGYLAGFKDCQTEYEEKLRWIPVEERLPENRERVLIKVLRSDKSTYIETGSVVLGSKLGIYWQSGHATQLNVTHWLSLSFL